MPNDRLSLAAVVTATLLAAGAAVAAPAAKAPQAVTESGRVAGVRAPGLSIFRGIPYAAPPVGPLRWRPPQAPAKWTGVRDATAYGHACPQDEAHKEPWAQVGPRSEDCLFLNVWTPAGAQKAAGKPAAGKLPVMVFLHGGGFTYGAAGVPLYEGSNLARRGVVLVTLNYRLGRLGYFAHPALTAEDPKGELGNYGVMDQVAALKWVKRNIAAFGGDPANITLFGESAGAGTVQIMMGSPASRGLFQKAISESGAGGTPLPPFQAAEADGVKWAKSLGLETPTAADLRAIPVEKTLARAFPFRDGKVVTASPGLPFARGAEAKVPLIIGANSGEASLPSNTTALARMVLGADYEPILQKYRARPGVPEADAARDLAEDVGSLEQSQFVGDLHARNGAATWTYNFDQVAPADRPKGFGTEHGGELEYLFGNEPPEHVWDDQDRRTSRLMGDYWVRFARTGNPNAAKPTSGAPNWPKVAGHPTARQVFHDGAHATTETPLEEEVKAKTLAAVEKLWAAEEQAGNN